MEYYIRRVISRTSGSAFYGFSIGDAMAWVDMPMHAQEYTREKGSVIINKLNTKNKKCTGKTYYLQPIEVK